MGSTRISPASTSCAATSTSRAGGSRPVWRSTRRASSLRGSAARPSSRRRRSAGWAMPNTCAGGCCSSGRAFQSCIELCRRHGFGRIEVASLAMAALRRLFAIDLEGALQEGSERGRGGERGRSPARRDGRPSIVFHSRIEARRDGHGAAERRARDRARTPARRPPLRGRGAGHAGCRSRRRPGAARPRAICSGMPLAISRETGMAYWGAIMLGWLALHTDDLDERRAALAEGEALLLAGGVGEPQLSRVLSGGDRDRAE